MTPSAGEPTNFELIEQALLRLDPETRHHVIQTMLLIQKMTPGDRRAFTRVLAASRPLPPFRMVSSCI